jgi:hypothetical protein
MKKIRNYRLEDTYFEAFKKQCKKDGLKMGEVIRKLIKEWLAK